MQKRNLKDQKRTLAAWLLANDMYVLRWCSIMESSVELTGKANVWSSGGKKYYPPRKIQATTIGKEAIHRQHDGPASSFDSNEFSTVGS